MQFLHDYSDSMYVGDTSLGSYPFRVNKNLSAVQAGEAFVKNFNEAPDGRYAAEAFNIHITVNSGINNFKPGTLTVGQAQLLLGPIEAWPNGVQYPDPSVAKKASFFLEALKTVAKLVPALNSLISAKITEFQNKPLKDLAQAIYTSVNQIKQAEKNREKSASMQKKILIGGGVLAAVGLAYFMLSKNKSKKNKDI